MKCYVCNGRGYFPVSNIAAKICPQCDGTGEIEQTNEEWFCSLPTEEKAKWITENLSVYADLWVKRDEKLLNPVTWEEWLKEIHKE